MTRIKLFVLFCVLGYCAAQSFNSFKSYKDAKVKPKQYATKNTDHDIEEYLTPLQQKMLRARTGKDTADVMFDNKWSGFNGFKAQKGKSP